MIVNFLIVCWFGHTGAMVEPKGELFGLFARSTSESALLSFSNISLINVKTGKLTEVVDLTSITWFNECPGLFFSAFDSTRSMFWIMNCASPSYFMSLIGVNLKTGELRNLTLGGALKETPNDNTMAFLYSKKIDKMILTSVPDDGNNQTYVFAIDLDTGISLLKCILMTEAYDASSIVVDDSTQTLFYSTSQIRNPFFLLTQVTFDGVLVANATVTNVYPAQGAAALQGSAESGVLVSLTNFGRYGNYKFLFQRVPLKQIHSGRIMSSNSIGFNVSNADTAQLFDVLTDGSSTMQHILLGFSPVDGGSMQLCTLPFDVESFGTEMSCISNFPGGLIATFYVPSK